jgi:hypothetical protein
MASIRKQIKIDTDPAVAWDALRDYGALHTRLARGFVVDTQLEGPDRIVTFAGGGVRRERLIDLDDADCRLCWSMVDGPFTHHNGVHQVFPTEDGKTLFVWTADFLPDDAAGGAAERMDIGLAAIKRTLEKS